MRIHRRGDPLREAQPIPQLWTLLFRGVSSGLVASGQFWGFACAWRGMKKGVGDTSLQGHDSPAGRPSLPGPPQPHVGGKLRSVGHPGAERPGPAGLRPWLEQQRRLAGRAAGSGGGAGGGRGPGPSSLLPRGVGVCVPPPPVSPSLTPSVCRVAGSCRYRYGVGGPGRARKHLFPTWGRWGGSLRRAGQRRSPSLTSRRL